MGRLLLIGRATDPWWRRRRVGDVAPVAAPAPTAAWRVPSGTMPPDDGTTRTGPRGAWDIPQIVTWTQDQKWSSLSPDFRRRLAGLRIRMQGKGHDFAIDGGFRPWSTQGGMVKAGASTVAFSYHNVVTDGLVPDAYGADLRPASRLSPADTDTFYRDLREEAVKAGLGSGGWWWKGSKAERAAERAKGRAAKLGWDAGHVELASEDLGTLRKRVAGFYTARGLDTSSWKAVDKEVKPEPGSDEGSRPDDADEGLSIGAIFGMLLGVAVVGGVSAAALSRR